MRGLALLVTLILAAAFAVSAAAQEPADTTVQFTLARVVHATPDTHRRIGIRVVCQEVSGCKVALAIARTGTTPPQVLGRVFTQLIGGTTETNYILLSKRTIALLGQRRSMKVVVTAEVTDPAGNKATFTKDATLLAAKKKR